MKIAVIGAGAIGCVVAGYLKLKGQDVCLIGKKDAVNAIRGSGLHISGVRGEYVVQVAASRKLDFEPDLAVLCTKTQDIEEVMEGNLPFLRSSTVLSTQNGIRAEEILIRYLPKEQVISSIVMFGATYLVPGKVAHNFEGSWVLGSMFQGSLAQKLGSTSLVLDKVANVVISDEIRAMKYTKIFVNANNCIPGILGISMQEAFSDIAISRISVALWKEGLDLVSSAGIKLASLPGFPLENVTTLAALPVAQAAGIFCGIMTKLSRDPVYGSILQSIMRGRPSEIDYINGEFVRLAQARGVPGGLNEALVMMVHEVERTGNFYSKEQLIAETAQYVR